MFAFGYKKKDAQMKTLENAAVKHSQWGDVFRRLRRNKLAMFGLILVVVIVLMSVFANFLTPYSPSAQVYSDRFMYPCKEHILGTDNYGRDLWTRILYGGRVSLLVALISTTIGIVVGGLIGATAGYFGGLYDSIVMRIIDIIMAIPVLLLAVALSAALGTGVINTGVAVGLSSITGGARILRSTVISIRDQQFVEAARSNGAGHWWIIMRHVLPNTVAPLIVDASLKIGMSILQISSLSFIGLGIQAPTPEWGSILADGRQYIRDFWPLVTFPGISIVMTLLGFNLLGDGLRDALDPKLKH